MPTYEQLDPLMKQEFGRAIAEYFNPGYKISNIIYEMNYYGVNNQRISSLDRSSEVLDNADIIIEEFPLANSYLRNCERSECSARTITRTNVYNQDGVEKWCNSCIATFAFRHNNGLWYSEPERVTQVGGYHQTNRRAISHGVDFKDPTLLGIEIETDVPFNSLTRNRIVEQACASGKILAERDGSLGGYGVEFIFAPTPFSKIDESSFIFDWARILRENGCRAWKAGDNYGMHINLNASTLTDLHAGKLCYFINNNRTLCEKIAGRPPNRWTTYNNMHLKNYRRETAKYLAASRRNSNRVEIRIFKASLTWERIRRNCEFADSCREFTKFSSVKELTPENYLAFIDNPSNKKKYSLLRKFLGLTKLCGVMEDV